MKQLHPRSVWLFFVKFILYTFWWVLILLYIITALLTKIIVMPMQSVISLLWWLLIIIPSYIVLLYIWARLSYYFYRYELTEAGFRKERGVIYKKYVTIPYDRIQNVDIYRGVLARILGLSELHIQTAGYSGYYIQTEGRLPGLLPETAEELRNKLITKTKDMYETKTSS